MNKTIKTTEQKVVFLDKAKRRQLVIRKALKKEAKMFTK